MIGSLVNGLAYSLVCGVGSRAVVGYGTAFCLYAGDIALWDVVLWDTANSYVNANSKEK